MTPQPLRPLDDGVAPSDSDDTYASPGRAVLDQRGTWRDEFEEDLARYAAHHDGRRLFSLLVEQGLWALLQYRIASALYRRAPGGRLHPLLGAVLAASQKFVEVVTGISLPFRAELAPGLYIGHFGPTLVHSGAVIGSGCNLSQGVSIGESGRGDRRGCPRIGRWVYVGANAVVAGRITVGDGAVIAANALVTRDVPAGCTVIGNPAVVVSERGTLGMGLHMRPHTR